MCLYKHRPLFVISQLFLMLATIQFNHQLLLDKGEVGDVSSNRMLATEAVPGKLFVAQCPPQHKLDIGHATPK